MGMPQRRQREIQPVFRTVQGKPSLGNEVRELQLYWEDYRTKENPQKLLCRLPNLQRSTIKVLHTYSFDPRHYRVPSTRLCFIEFDLCLETPTRVSLVDLLLVNGVHKLQLDVPEARKRLSIPPPTPSQAKIAPLESFIAIELTIMSNDDL